MKPQHLRMSQLAWLLVHVFCCVRIVVCLPAIGLLACIFRGGGLSSYSSLSSSCASLAPESYSSCPKSVRKLSFQLSLSRSTHTAWEITLTTEILITAFSIRPSSSTNASNSRNGWSSSLSSPWVTNSVEVFKTPEFLKHNFGYGLSDLTFDQQYEFNL